MLNYVQSTNAATAAKVAWAPGIWLSEPDAATWNDDESNLLCAANRDPTTGALSCQVGFTSGQAPLYNMALTAMPCIVPTSHARVYMDGGNVWWLQCYFDTAADGQPATNYQLPQYRSWQHILDHCTRMARQLATVLGGSGADEGLPATGTAGVVNGLTDTP